MPLQIFLYLEAMCGPSLDFTQLPKVPRDAASKYVLASGFLPTHITNMFIFNGNNNSGDLCALDDPIEPPAANPLNIGASSVGDHRTLTLNTRSTSLPPLPSSSVRHRSDPPMEHLRGRQCEVDAILEALGHPPAVVEVAAQSGATTRAALLMALREEERWTKWRLGMHRQPFEERPGTRRHTRPLPLFPDQSDSLSEASSPPKSSHRRGWSLDSALELGAACEEDVTDDAPLQQQGPDSSLRQRFLSDAERSLDSVRPPARAEKITIVDKAASTSSGDVGLVRRDSRTLPRPMLIRSASAA